MRRSAIVDTNVPLLANGKGSASPSCVIHCIRALLELKSDGRVVIDSRWRILSEYQNKLHSSGQPGPGDAFLKWVLSNLTNPRRCHQVPITEKAGVADDFEEFPRRRELRGFDPSDRKFVAVAVADPEHPPILQGFDSKWWGFRAALAGCGVEVEFLCSEELESKFKKKMGR